jgi:mannonate dehydratase
MNRREFVATSGVGALALSIPSSPRASEIPSKRALMKLGCQSGPADETHIAYLARYGVRNFCASVQTPPDRLYPTVEELNQLRDTANKYGVSLDMIDPPFLASTHIDNEKHPAIMLGQSPERDRDIEAFQTVIRNCAAAGVPCVKYNMSLLGVERTGRTQGRGDAAYSTWRLQDAHPPAPLTRAGRVDADTYWERITYFLERVVPVAAENKVRLACHPHDPGMPPEGYQGVDTVLGTVDGLKKFVSIHENPYHGLNFCQGCVSEMLDDPGKEIYDVIRYFGSREKIFNVHFRNIRGHRNDFAETFPDEGDVNFWKAIQVYKEVGYSCMLMPDHVPAAANDPRGLQSFAFAYGYIRALIQAVDQTA